MVVSPGSWIRNAQATCISASCLWLMTSNPVPSVKRWAPNQFSQTVARWYLLLIFCFSFLCQTVCGAVHKPRSRPCFRLPWSVQIYVTHVDLGRSVGDGVNTSATSFSNKETVKDNYSFQWRPSAIDTAQASPRYSQVHKSFTLHFELL